VNIPRFVDGGPRNSANSADEVDEFIRDRRLRTRWFFLLGVVPLPHVTFATYFVARQLLFPGMTPDWDLIAAYAFSIAVGVACLWRLPVDLDVRFAAVVIYLPIATVTIAVLAICILEMIFPSPF
jgi:hypothetical protein